MKKRRVRKERQRCLICLGVSESIHSIKHHIAREHKREWENRGEEDLYIPEEIYKIRRKEEGS